MEQETDKGKKKKTYKREVALILIVGLIYMAVTGDASMVEILVWPFMSFAALAFGLEWKGNQ